MGDRQQRRGIKPEHIHIFHQSLKRFQFFNSLEYFELLTLYKGALHWTTILKYFVHII